MKQSRFLSILLAAVLLLSVVAPAGAADVGQTGDLTGSLVILHTNDTHGADLAVAGTSIGTAGVAQLKKDYEARGAEVLLLSAGDAVQGTPLVNLSQGASAVEFMNAAGYDAMAAGNHEFDWGYDNLKSLVADMDFPFLAANILDTATKKPVFQANKIFETKAGKVGVFGLATPETMTKAHPDKVKGLTILMGDELFASAQAQVKELKDAGCDLIIALGHLGIDEESAGNRSTDLLAKVTGIDLFIDGHSHSVLDGNAKENQIGGTMLVSTGTALANVGAVTYKDKQLTAKLISAADYSAADSEVAALVATVNDKVEAQLSAKFAETKVLLNGERSPGVRTQSTNLGNFAADAILWSARQFLGDSAVDAAITNGGGIRASIKVGDVTMKDMKTVFPFGNAVTTISVTGAQLLEALEAATYCTPTAVGAFPQVSGLTFTIDTTVEYENGPLYPDSTYHAPAKPGTRVLNVTVGGKPLDLEKTYVIATNDFTAAGGDTYYVFKGLPSYNTTVALEDALVNYTAKVLGGVIGDQYATGEGRITVITNPFSDVGFDDWYYSAVITAYKDGLMLGVGGDSYGAKAEFTTASYLTVLYRMYPETFGTDKATTGAKWDEAAKYLNEHLALNIESLNAPISRELMAHVAAQVLKAVQEKTGLTAKAVNEAIAFTDLAEIDEGYAQSVTWFQSVGGINGIPNGDGSYSYNPDGIATRSQAAQIVYNLSHVLELSKAS
ncbi:hypothetical protein SDC9_69150 [bioreactor metagenome]|uniref:SLH domain-containing protein n=1 Tax=bioreactor metagenome TaxID=1076179 RepID=A0A644Y2C9_9ZZZZ